MSTTAAVVAGRGWEPTRGGASLPPADHQPSPAWPAARIRSRCPHPEVTTPNRLDPFWDGLWGRSSSLSWLTSATMRAHHQAGLLKLPKTMQRDAERARRLVLAPEGWARRLRLLGAVDFWRTLSSEQAAVVTGDLTVLDFQRRVPLALFQAGLVDVGSFSGVVRNTKLHQPRAAVYRPSNTTVFDRRITPHLTFPEWVSITGGQPWSSASQFDRHNLLAAELGLRLFEYADIGTVLGEKLSSIELLAGSGLGRSLPFPDRRSADLTIVRPDGLRIAVELTATTTGRFREKVERWAKLLADQPLEHSGLVVVFVIANPIERHGAAGKNSRNAAATVINQMCRQYPGWVGNRVAERIAIADWQEWFPERHTLSQHFFDLRCLTPSGPPERLWQVQRWLARDSTGAFLRQFQPNQSAPDFTAVLDNVQSLAGIPHWARDPDNGIRMWQLMLAERDHDHFPVPESARPERLTGAAFGSPRGVSGAPQPPVRLRGL